MVREGCGLEPEEIKLALEWLRLAPGQLLKIVEDLKHPHEVRPHVDEKIVSRMAHMRRRVAELVKLEMGAIATHEDAGAKGGCRHPGPRWRHHVARDHVWNASLLEQAVC